MLLKPQPLRRGDKIAIFAPSSGASHLFPDRFRHGVSVLREVLDVEVVVGRTCLMERGFVSASPLERAAELKQFLEDDTIKGIFFTTGGFNSGEILDLINFGSLKAQPKIIVGYSDCTALLLAIHAQLGWVTFYGPAVMTQFGEYPTILPFTLSSFLDVVAHPRPQLVFEPPGAWTDERLEWGNGDWLARPRRLKEQCGNRELRAGSGSGMLWGGNIETLNFLVGTKYWKPPASILLFIEAVEAEAFLPRVRRALTHLRQCGLLDNVQGLLIGRSPDATDVSGLSLDDVVMERVADYQFPVLADVAFGHTDPMLTLPIGIDCSIHTHEGKGSIVLNGKAVFEDGGSYDIPAVF
ncbi:LD-carboxypeptidase (plasmid) [Agrobacterium tumefaciens]|uniref:LD-carboxypeptidase n=1 Tax=Agrobacterium tumefaciens TaxID=358 RepID=A0AAE6BHF9_AGRTU|nr:S66 peptidase family protein [Agrobacterium tumefaciens]QCL82901.1 LD-carboxypeptidase [Agrobacterium tumefaciens]